MTLKASAANGASSSSGVALGLLAVARPCCRARCPCIGGTSSGDGSSSTIASSSGCTPLFLKAEPQRTGVTLRSSVARCSDLAIRSCGISSLVEVGLHQLVVVVGAGLDQVGARLVGGVGQVGGDLLVLELGAELVLPDEGLVLDQVDDALERRPRRRSEAGSAAGWRRGGRASSRRRFSKSAPMRSILLMKAMRGTRYLSAWRQTVSDWGSTPATESKTAIAPSRTRSERSTSTVKSTWPGRVDDVDPVAVPLAGGRGGGDRDAALLLLLHPVHDGGALVDLAHLVGAAGVVEDALGRRRLTGVDVSHDPDVAGLFEWEGAWHLCRKVSGCRCCSDRAAAPLRRRRSGRT